MMLMILLIISLRYLEVDSVTLGKCFMQQVIGTAKGSNIMSKLLSY